MILCCMPRMLRLTPCRCVCLVQVRHFGRQLFVALRHLHACDHVHADLKPDNILIGGEKRNLLKLCDFGTAVPFWELPEYKATRYMQSRFYRAPEVLLGTERSAAMDIWSAGCVLFELASGQFAFTGDSNLELLRSMTTVLGPVPARVVRAAPFRDAYYMPGRDILLPPAATATNTSQVVAPGVSDVKARLTAAVTRSRVRAVKAKHPRNAAKIEAARSLNEGDRADIALMSDFLERVFVFEPSKRLTAEQALRHEFLREVPGKPSK